MGSGSPLTEQPYTYVRRELVEPDWRRFPGWRDVSVEQWQDVQWQRVNCVRGPRQLAAVTGSLLPDVVLEDLAADAAQTATMSTLVTPQMLNTMAPDAAATGAAFGAAFVADPIRRYMLPLRSERHDEWPSHPEAARDPLHEADMWAVEGLTRRYPTKALVELVTTCPQYCGHCTRMDLVGNSTPQVSKARFAMSRADRFEAMLTHLVENPGIRDVVISGGDVANVPWPRLESFVERVLEIDSIRDVRLASKAVAGLPQHWLSAPVVEGMARLGALAHRRGVDLAVHTHVNHVQSVTPLVARAAATLRECGVGQVRNQGVLLRGVNTTPAALLDLCFALQDEARISPYYFYMCDLVPWAEHWRIPLWEAQALQEAIMGYLPGFATPRLVCDVPGAGKKWVHQVEEYDRIHGVSAWTKNFRTVLDRAGASGDELRFHHYDPVHSLPEAGQDWWRQRIGVSA